MPDTPAKAVTVVGAGMVGLSVAWFLQEHGVEVTVLDRKGVAAGSSWGNAGWVSPGLTTPLPEPSVLRYGLRSLLRSDAPLYVPPSLDLSLVSFLLKFARRCTEREWQKAMSAYIPLNNQALEAYQTLSSSGNSLELKSAPIMAAFKQRDQARDLLNELEMIRQAGQPVETTILDGGDLRANLPQLSSEVDFGIRIDGQSYIDPGSFTTKLGASVAERGATIIVDKEIASIYRDRGTLRVTTTKGETISSDAVVLATGAWISRLAKPLGVRMPVQAGRGYSFLVNTTGTVPYPIYFPAVRVACTPMGTSSLRVAGTMEFRKPDFRLDPSRLASLKRSAIPLLEGVDWASTVDEWVGPRPVTADGMPLIGESKTPGVFIAGGHGMWGITLGPATGRLLASQIVTGKIPLELRPFDPTR